MKLNQKNACIRLIAIAFFCLTVPVQTHGQEEVAAPSSEPTAEPTAATVSIPKTQQVSDVRIVLIPKGIDRTVVQNRIHVKAGDELNPERVSQDIQRIFQLGFFENIQVTVDHDEKGSILTYYVQQRPMVETIELVGLDLEEDKQGQIESRALALSGRFYDPGKFKVSLH